MKRRIRWVMSLWAASMVAGCASGPVVKNTAFNRQEPTRVRSLLIVVDDTLFGEASDAAKGARFARTLGSTLKDTAGSIPVTLLQIDSASDARALPRTILSSHATQMMVIKATRVTTRSRGGDSAIWQLAISDVSATVVPDATNPSKSGTRVVTRTFYRDQAEANFDDTLGLLIRGQNSFAEQLGMAIADRLRADHVLMPDDSPAPVEPQSQAPVLGNTVTMPATTQQHNVEIAMHGQYASIDTKTIAEVMIRLQKTAGHENDGLIVEIEHEPGNYAPPVFFELSRTLFKQGNIDDAVFWFNAARLRGDFDAARCADPTARSAVSAMVSTMPVELRRGQFNDMTKLKDTINKVLTWDRTTPYDYDYRWINLHGMNAISSGMGDAAADNKPLSLPKEQWPALAEKNRQDYLASLDAAIDQVTKARAAK